MTAKKLPVYKIDGSQNGEIELSPAIFGARVNQQLLDLVVKAHAAGQRQGTHDTKERKEVSGGGKKPWRQKGTGRARQGSTRAPQWRGGGTVFGPTPRDYDIKVSQTTRNQALISALSFKCQKENLQVVESFALAEPKTKELVRALKALKLTDTRTLCVVSECGENLKRAFGNLRELFSVKRAGDVNAYHVMRRRQLVIEKNALSILEKRLLETDEPSKRKELVTA